MTPTMIPGVHRILVRIGCLAGLSTWQAAAQPTIGAFSQPKDFSVSVGANVTHLVAVTGGGETGTLVYQWWFNNTPLAGATARLLTLNNVQTVQAGNYWLVASDSSGSVTSRVAKLEVDTTFTKITTGPVATDRNCVAEGSAVDYDRDGDLDLFVAGFGPGRSAFYRNNGDGTFTRLTDAKAMPFLTLGEAVPAAWGDYDNDGFPDLALIAGYDYSAEVFRNCRFYRNNRDGTFSPGPAIERNSAWTAAWADYDHDGFLDLLVPQIGSQTTLLFHNDGRGGFTRATTNEVGTLVADLSRAGAPAWADYDDDGWLDVLMRLLSPTYDVRFTPFRNLGAGRFQPDLDSGLLPSELRPFTSVWGDYDNDGRLDLLFANISPGTSGSLATLYRNKGQGRFEDVSATALPRLEGDAANSVSMADYDNDGYLDAYLTYANELLHNNGDGTFSRIAAGSPVNDTLPDPSGSYVSQWFDYDNDGFLDLFLPCGSDSGAGGLVPSFLYRNNGNGNHWLKVRLVGTASNRMGIGAKVRVKTTVAGKELWQRRDTTAGGIYNGNQPEAHFGLGLASTVDLLRVEWPSGNVQEWTDLAANQVYELTEVAVSTPVRPVVTVNGTAVVTNSVPGSAHQWYFGGAALVGRTSRILTVSNAQPAQAGRYTMVTQTDAGPQTNHVYVRVDTQFTKILEGEIVTETESNSMGLWFDVDNDGYADLFTPNGRVRNSLFRNLRDGTFARLEDTPLVNQPDRQTVLASKADYDNDGDTDVFVVSFDAPCDLFRNEGNGAFSRLDVSLLAPDLRWFAGVAWADYDRDGDVDLFAAAEDRYALLRNDGNAVFSAQTPNDVGVLLSEAPPGRPNLFNWNDFDADGDADILLFYAQGTPRLYENLGNGRFARRLAGSLTSLMNDFWCAFGDYDNDGLMDAYTSRWQASVSRLHHNVGGGNFEVVSSAGDLTSGSRSVFGTWADYDNDGFLDLLVMGYNSGGGLYRNRGDGTFASVPIGNLLTDGVNRSSVQWADYDHNGFLDLFVACGDGIVARNQLYRNNGNGNHWLQIRLVGTASNRDALGARIRLSATIGGRLIRQMRELWGDVGNDSTVHFGLGNATRVTSLRIEWPSGTVQDMPGVVADQFLTVIEPTPVRLQCSVVPGGVRIECRGAPNSPYDLQASSDLLSWWFLATVKDVTGVSVYIDTPSDPTRPRFYRAVGP